MSTTLSPTLERTLKDALGDRDAARQVRAALEGDTVTTVGVGAPAGTGVACVDSLVMPHKTVLTLTNLAIAVASAAGGSQKIYDFPEGNITVLGATFDLSTVGSGGLGATASIVGALGTVAAAADATLTSTEADVIPSQAGTLVASAGTLKGESTSIKVADGTTTPVDLFLNLAQASAGAGTLTVSGTVTLIWHNSGDN